MTEIKCTGLIFQGYESSWWCKKTKTMNHREGFRLLKKQSCKCRDCSYVLEDLDSYYGEILSGSYWSKAVGVNDVSRFERYKLIPSFDCEGLEEFQMKIYKV